MKRVFIKIVDDLGVYYKIGLNTDFTGKLFNEMYSWLGFTQDQLNDVVLTPPYVATLLCRLARVNKDSFVWDFATGSAGLLVAAMNEMLADAKKKIKSPEELARKSAEIKANQLLGLEILSNVYMLAVLNMIMMGDGIPAPIAKRQAKTYLIQIGQKNAIRKLLIWFVSEKRSSVFLQKKNTTRSILIQITEVTGIKLLRSTQNQLWMISKRQ